MTLLGKIFTMMIFILCLMCMFFAVAVYQTDKNWKDVVVNESEAEGKPLGLKIVVQNK